MEKLMYSFSTSERLRAAHSIWDSEKFVVKTLWCSTSNKNYDRDTNETGCDEVTLGLIEGIETEKKPR